MHGKVDFSPLDPQEVPFSPLNVSGAPALGLLQWLLHLPEPSSPDAPLTNHCRGSGGVGNYLFLRLSPCRDGPQGCFLLHSAPGLDVSSSSSAGSGLPPVTEGHFISWVVLHRDINKWDACVPPKWMCWRSNPQRDGVRRWDLWEVTRVRYVSEGGVPMMGLVSL